MEIITDDFLSNLGVSSIIIGIIIILASFKYTDFLKIGIIMLIVGGVIFWIRNKDKEGYH